MNEPTRNDALELLRRYTATESLIKHALSVEAVMRFEAHRAGADESEWGILGLIHDFDYERFPDEHCAAARRILEAEGWPEKYIRGVEAHAWTLFTDVRPESLMEKTLFTIDELTGFVYACALVRPSRSVCDLEVSSVRKKWKTKSFAATVNRGIVEKGLEMLARNFDDLTADVIEAMRARSNELGV